MSVNDTFSGSPHAGAPVRSTAAQMPVLVTAYLLTMLFPSTTIFHIGPVLLSPQKLLFVLIAVPVTMQMLTTIRLRSYDYCYFGYVGWFVFCTLLNYGVSKGGWMVLTAMSAIVPYALAQVAIRRSQTLVPIVRFQFVMVICLGILAVPEAITHQRFLPDAISALIDHWPYFQNDIRWGLLRAASVFQHPILYGLFSGSILAFTWYLSRTGSGALFSAGLVLAATFTALSAGPLMSVMVQLGLIVGERLTRGIKRRGLWLMLALVAGYFAIDLLSTRPPIRVIISYLTINPGTAFYRLLIFEHASDDILRNPIFGFRTETWTRLHWMVQSVDNYWLLQTMRSGFPGLFLQAAAIILIVRALFRQPDAELTPIHARLRRGAAYAIVGFCVCGATVAMFGKLEPYFAFLVGIGAALARIAEEGRARPAGTADTGDPTPPPAHRRTVL